MARLFTVGNSSSVYRSDDNGLTWALKNAALPALNYLSVSMQNGNTDHVAIGAHVGSGKPMLLISLDGGETWLNKQINVISPLNDSDVVSIQWVDDNTIFASVYTPSFAGGYYLVRSINQGVSWSILHTVGDEGFRYHVSMYDGSVGFWGKYRLTVGGTVKTNIPGSIKSVKAQRGGTEAAAVYTGNSNTGVSVDSGLTFDSNGNNGVKIMYANHYPRTSDGKFMAYWKRNNGSGSNFTFIIIRELVNGSLATEIPLVLGGSDIVSDGFFIDGDLGVFVTEKGRVYRTVNAAGSFSAIPAFTANKLLAIDGENVLTSCAVEVTVDDVEESIGGINGSVTFTAVGGTGGPTDYEYLVRLQGSSSNTYGAIGSNPKTVTGLAPGIYEVVVRDSDFNECADSVTFEVVDIPNLLAIETHTNVTAAGAADGTITIQVNAGSGNYEIIFDGMPPSIFAATATKIDLATGVYNISVKDLITAQAVLFEIVITEPSIDPTPGGSFLQVPMMNSLHFVKRETPNGCETFQTMDNVLFCEQKENFPGFKWKNYYQKVQKCDILPIQFYSDYDEHLIELVNYITDVVVDASYIAAVKQQNTNVENTFNIFITADVPGKSRVYFQVGGLPIPLQGGDLFEIFNNADGFDGSYQIVSIQNDVLLGQQYLVINKVYGIVAAASNAEARFLVSSQTFNVLEVIFNNLGSQADGKYQIRISGTSGPVPQTWTSEPIDLMVTHEGTNCIDYRCFDNSFDMTWITGITCRIRVESTLFKRLPSGEDDNYRNQDQSVVVLSAKRRRGFTFELWQLPPYLHEKLSVIFGCDLIQINGVRYQTDELYQEPKYITRYPLSNSQIAIEQYGWFDKFNSNDIGPVDVGDGFIIANNGFLRR